MVTRRSGKWSRVVVGVGLGRQERKRTKEERQWAGRKGLISIK